MNNAVVITDAPKVNYMHNFVVLRITTELNATSAGRMLKQSGKLYITA